ncbi:hypothetical protein Pth03_12280 [Planotetraspora thailandica]|uniref:Uncharacterized protein n=1 Tax=Planotetraspora thailandica TaxID=487172 RepID=A0A8J3UVM3_9ACTN|nr:hypothetical protein Pth03_12280 [Planotetraspora thailandica]
MFPTGDSINQSNPNSMHTTAHAMARKAIDFAGNDLGFEVISSPSRVSITQSHGCVAPVATLGADEHLIDDTCPTPSRGKRGKCRLACPGSPLLRPGLDYVSDRDGPSREIGGL